MSKNKIWIIISLMSLASLALIAFQIYGIGYSARSNNEVFGANVRESMQEVVRKLEKQELIYITNKRTIDEQKRKELLAISRSNANKKQPRLVKKRIENLVATNVFDGLQPSAQSDVLNFDPRQILGRNLPLNEISFQINLDNPSIDDIDQINQFNQFVVNQMDIYQKLLNDSVVIKTNGKSLLHKSPSKHKKKFVANNDNYSKNQYAKMSEKSQLMKDVFDDYVLKERPIYERINKLGLDSLLRHEISQRGINIPIEYGIALNNDTTRLHFVSSPTISPQNQNIIKQKGYKANLFPNDMFNGDNKLFVYFPDKKAYIMRSIWMNILGSIAMISIVLACFYVAVNIILKQKKLADIKNDFINNMTHEFKTPISTISLACEVLNDKDMSANPTVISRYLGIIKDENKRLGTQVEKVLQTALMDKGEVKMILSDLNVHDTILKVVDNISPQIDLKNGTIHLALNATNANVEADQVHITNIIFNLLDNAIKYSKEKPDITLESKNVENGILISVTDKGIGLSNDVQKNIFEKFYRVPTGNLHDVKGFGLGLSYVKKMVEEHHGSIKVKSKLAEGSSFEIFLPQLPKNLYA
jgi:two-component system, OmpR family, phosphate regulon sensor histidine kinase PhoR